MTTQQKWPRPTSPRPRECGETSERTPAAAPGVHVPRLPPRTLHEAHFPTRKSSEVFMKTRA